MASKWVDERDMRFILHEVFNIQELLLGKAPFEDHDTDMVNMVLDAAAKFAENEIAPTYPDEVHRKPIEAVFKDGKVYAGIISQTVEVVRGKRLAEYSRQSRSGWPGFARSRRCSLRQHVPRHQPGLHHVSRPFPWRGETGGEIF
jgi:hypothetical protein